MSVSYAPIPSRDDLLALFQAAVANAEGLLGDAELLVEFGRFPRAHALATPSWEELSKGQLCLLAAVFRDLSPEDFWTRFRDHESKLAEFTCSRCSWLPHPLARPLPMRRRVLAMRGLRRTLNCAACTLTTAAAGSCRPAGCRQKPCGG